MTTPVEARSLSSLTQIFANPPQYPRNPTHQTLEPLVLYIVRVPGSKDVFLTPLKPPTKTSISVEAIESSLYYFHVSTPEDQAVRKSLEEISQSYNSEGGLSQTIHRKPLSSLPTTEQSTSKPRASPTKRRPLPTSQDSERSYRFGSGIKVENATPLPLEPSRRSHLTISRKPVGPRPLTSRSESSDSQSLPKEHGYVSETPHLPPDRRDDTSSVRMQSSECFKPPTRGDDSVDRVGYNPPSDTETSTISHTVEQIFNVTVVRRDPTSGAQWNVGTLSRERRGASIGGDRLIIQITTPGYQKFAGQVHLGASTTRPPGKATVGSKDHETAEQFPAVAPQRASESNGTIVASRSSSTAAFTSELVFTRPSASSQRKGSQQQRSSSDSLPPPPINPVSPMSPISPSPLAFTSPWHGTCTFTTGMDGRSLKCRHQLPNSNLEQRDTSVNIAELRFNLPWSALKRRDVNSAAPATAMEQCRRPSSLALIGEDAKHGFHRGMARIKQEMRPSSIASSKSFPSDTAALRSLSPSHGHRPPTSTSTSLPSVQGRSRSKSEQASNPDSIPIPISDSDPDPDPVPRLDLKLGRERAGGGRKGNSAKLGKLVLRDEGLKMADLVVSACMGVWWDIYDGKVKGGSA